MINNSDIMDKAKSANDRYLEEILAEDAAGKKLSPEKMAFLEDYENGNLVNFSTEELLRMDENGEKLNPTQLQQLQDHINAMEPEVIAPTQGEFEKKLLDSTDKFGFDNDLNDIRFLVNYLSESTSLDLMNSLHELPIVGGAFPYQEGSSGNQSTKDALKVANIILKERLGITDGEIKREGMGRFYLEHNIKQPDGGTKMQQFDLNRPGQNVLADGLARFSAAVGDTYQYLPIIAGIVGTIRGGPHGGSTALVGSKAILESTRKARVEKITGKPSARSNTLLVAAGMPTENFVTGKIIQGGVAAATGGGTLAKNIINKLSVMNGGSTDAAEQLMKNVSKVANTAKVSIKPVTDWISMNITEPMAKQLTSESKVQSFLFNLNNKIYSKAAEMTTPKGMKEVLQRDPKQIAKFFQRIRGNKPRATATEDQFLVYLKDYADNISETATQKQPTALDKAMSGIKDATGKAYDRAKEILPSLQKLKNLDLQTQAVSDPEGAVNSLNNTIDELSMKMKVAGDDLTSATDDVIKASADDIQHGQTIKEDFANFQESKKKYFQSTYTENIDGVNSSPQVLDEGLSKQIHEAYKAMKTEIEGIISSLKGSDDLLAAELKKAIGNEVESETSVLYKPNGQPFVTTTEKALTDKDVVDFYRKMGEINIEGNYYKDGTIGMVSKKASKAMNGAKAQITDILDQNVDTIPESLQTRLSVMKEQKAYHDTFTPDVIGDLTQNPKKTIDAYKKIFVEDPNRATAIADQAFTNIPDKKVLYRKAIYEGVEHPEKALERIKKNLSLGGAPINESTVLKAGGLTDEVVEGTNRIGAAQDSLNALKASQEEVTGQLGAAKQYAQDVQPITNAQKTTDQYIAQLQNDIKGKNMTPEEINIRIKDISMKSGVDPAELRNAMGELPEQYKNIHRQSVLAKTMSENSANRSNPKTFTEALTEYTDSTAPYMQDPAEQAAARLEAERANTIMNKVLVDTREGVPQSVPELGSLVTAGASKSASLGNYAYRMMNSLAKHVNPEGLSGMAYGLGEALNTGAAPAAVGGRLSAPISSLGNALGNMGGDVTFSQPLRGGVETTPEEELERSRTSGALGL